VVFQRFSATHFATQFNLSTPSEIVQPDIRHAVVFAPGLWSRKSRHPTPTPGNFDYPTPDRLRPSAVLVT